MTRRAFALLMLGWPGLALGAPTASGTLRASMGGEVDTNARREIEELAEEPIRTDALLRVVVDGEGRADLGRGWRVSGQLLAGVKRFVEESSEDQWVQFTQLEIAKTIGPVTIGPSGAFRISRVRRGVRDYALQRARLNVEVELGGGRLAGMWGAWDAYQFEPEPRFSYAGPGGGLVLRQQLGDPLLLTSWFELYQRLYDGPILVAGDGNAERIFCQPTASAPCLRRRDSEFRVGAQLRYRGPVLAGVSYQIARQRSNSEPPLEDVVRHRVSAFATAPLPLDLLLSVQAALQVFDGDTPTGELLLGDEDEDRNNVQVQLRRPLWSAVSAEARYAYYANQLGGGSDLDFSRHTFFLGLSLRTEGRTVDDGSGGR